MIAIRVRRCEVGLRIVRSELDERRTDGLGPRIADALWVRLNRLLSLAATENTHKEDRRDEKGGGSVGESAKASWWDRHVRQGIPQRRSSLDIEVQSDGSVKMWCSVPVPATTDSRGKRGSSIRNEGTVDLYSPASPLFSKDAR